jgi:hypothetical protein
MFRVEWIQSALDELATIWNQASSGMRQAITAAAHQAEQILLADPYNAGESRPGGRRILLTSPLGMTFRVEAEGQTVTVLRVWLFRQRTQP